MPSYLVRPKGRGYAFRIAVPKPLRDCFPGPNGKPRSFIVEGLATDSPKEAQAKARKKLVEWTHNFERAKHGTPLVLAEIADAADKHYSYVLRQMESRVRHDPGMDQDEWLSVQLDRLQEALANDDWELIVADIERAQRDYGATTLDPTSPLYTKLARALLQAEITAIENRMKALHGEHVERPDPTSFLDGVDRYDLASLKPKVLTRPIVRLKAEYGPWSLFEQWVGKTKPVASTVNRWRAVFLNLQDKFEDKEITEDDAGTWADELVSEERSHRTVSEVWLSAARTVYGWAADQKPRLVSSNPLAKVRIRVPDKVVVRHKRFSTEEMQTILKAASKIEAGKSAFKAAQRWCPWLAAYSGARMGELTQLRGQDIIQQDGIWIMRLSPEAGTIKTKEFRDVPLHQHILDQGFLDFVKSRGDGPLFYNPDSAPKKNKGEDDDTNPARPRAVKTRERLAAWIRALGIKDKGISPTHGFRLTFKSIAASKEAKMPDRTSDAITGHAPATVAGRYEHVGVDDMAEALKHFPRYLP